MAIFKLKISDGNAKLKKTAKILAKKWKRGRIRLVAFNLPAGDACPEAGICAAYCYAKQGNFRFKEPTRLRQDNYDAVRAILATSGSEGLARVLSANLDLARYKRGDDRLVVRIHDSGDFFSRAYLKAWILVAEQNPEDVYYAYTKAILRVKHYAIPENLRLVQSVGGRQDKHIDLSKPHSRVFDTHADRTEHGYEDGNSKELGDIPAILGEQRIGLVYHGNAKLTPAQKRAVARARTAKAPKALVMAA